ncbi:neutrophil defensin 6-like [Macaca fascicularis]|uniref:Mammalian defensins domain-containing protein n=1 Tax=Macaca fascicularis TaxID=9541 RepID=A0A2K5TPY9_MACFA|nr:PREDICTED: neutrophil defensin 6-like [Macaca fascicularis]
MRTLAVLAAILLFTLQAQAESLQERADEVATQEQPGEDDQDLAVSFEENGLSTLRDSGSQARRTCYCRNKRCFTPEFDAGKCKVERRTYKLCCR